MLMFVFFLLIKFLFTVAFAKQLFAFQLFPKLPTFCDLSLFFDIPPHFKEFLASLHLRLILESHIPP